jgi:hypothetical protein
MSTYSTNSKVGAFPFGVCHLHIKFDKRDSQSTWMAAAGFDFSLAICVHHRARLGIDGRSVAVYNTQAYSTPSTIESGSRFPLRRQGGLHRVSKNILVKPL